MLNLPFKLLEKYNGSLYHCSIKGRRVSKECLKKLDRFKDDQIGITISYDAFILKEYYISSYSKNSIADEVLR